MGDCSSPRCDRCTSFLVVEILFRAGAAAPARARAAGEGRRGARAAAAGVLGVVTRWSLESATCQWQCWGATGSAAGPAPGALTSDEAKCREAVQAVHLCVRGTAQVAGVFLALPSHHNTHHVRVPRSLRIGLELIELRDVLVARGLELIGYPFLAHVLGVAQLRQARILVAKIHIYDGEQNRHR